MDLATLVWAVVPVMVLHLLVARRWVLLQTLLLVDVVVVLALGRVALAGLTLGAGVPGAAEWGMPPTSLGSPEQTDLPLQFHVWWEEVRRLVAAGEPPWVSDRIGGGTALFAHGQTGLPFPLHLPVWVLGAQRGTVVMAVWKLVLAGLGAALFLHRLGVRSAAVVMGGVGWAANLYLLSWLVVPLAWVVAATGWVLWAVVGALRGRRAAAALAALLLGVLCGWSVHPESAVFLLAAAGGIGLLLAWGRRGRLKRLVPLLLLLPVAAIGALPTLAAVSDSSKLAGSQARPFYPFPWLTPPVQLRLFLQTLVPWRDGHPAEGSWDFAFPAAPFATAPGLLPLVLLLAGGVRRRHRRLAAALGALAAAVVVLEFQPPLVTPLLAAIPGVASLTWVRAAFLLPFALTVLGALGLDAWLRRPHPVRLTLVAAAVQGLALLAALVTPVRPLPPPAKRTLLVPAAAAALSPFASLGGGVIWPFLAGGEALAQGWEVLPGVAKSPPEGAGLRLLEELAAGQEGRVLGVGHALPANTAARWGLADLRAHDPVRPKSLARLHAALGAEGADLPGDVTRPWAGLAGAWGVQWLAAPPEGIPEGQAEGWLEVWRGEGGRIYGNLRALPPVRLASRAVAPPGEAGDGEWEEVDFRTTAVVEGRLPRLGGWGTVTIQERRPHRWRVTVRAEGEVLALLHVPWTVGWQAYLDGAKVEMVTANVAAMGVVVPAGEHQVEWHYAPVGLALGVGLTAIGLAGCAAWGWSGRRR